MRNQRPEQHLSYDDLMRTLVDQADLGPARQAHLASCPHCRHQAEELKKRFGRLGKTARKLAPEPVRPFRVPVHGIPGGRWHFKPATALAMIGVLIFVFTVWWPRSADHVDAPVPMVADNLEQDDRMMGEIDDILDNALPEDYQQLAVVSESHNIENVDELMDWIVPSIDEEDDLEPQA